MRKAYMYMRVSTQTQVDEGFGLDIQQEEIGKYANDNGIEVCGTFTDEGVSGTTVERAGLQDMLLSLDENADVKYIICYNVSRLWRSDISGGLIRYELSKRKIDIISVQEPSYSLYIDDPSQFLISQIMQALASYDRMQITQKLAKGRRAKVQKGTKGCGTAPIGYRWNKDAETEIDADNSAIVLDIYTSYIRYRSLAKVADYCKQKGYKTQQGNDFSKQSLKNILTNDYYIGVVRFGSVERRGSHPTFISAELFSAVQSLLKRTA
jgi:DNA invertase Pin-like site-specific DNA recombinase